MVHATSGKKIPTSSVKQILPFYPFNITTYLKSVVILFCLGQEFLPTFPDGD